MSPFVLALCASFFWGVSAIVEKIGLRGAEPLAGVLARSVGVTLAALMVYGMHGPTRTAFHTMDGTSRGLLISGGVLASVGAQIFFYRALKTGDVGRVAAVGGSWPVVAFLLSCLFLNESITLRKAVGVALVTLGALFLR